MRDLLFRSIFVKQEIFLVQTADNARGVLLQDQRVNCHQIDVYLDDLGRCRDRGRLACVILVV